MPLYRSDSVTTGVYRYGNGIFRAGPGSSRLARPHAPDAAERAEVRRRGQRLCGSRERRGSSRRTGGYSVPLRGGTKDEAIRVVLTNRYAPDAKTEYTIRVRKAPTTAVHFDVEPSDALVYIYEKVSGNRVWPEDGAFALSEGFTYQCTVTKVGYVGQSGELALANGVLTFDEMEYPDLAHVSVKLEQAAKDSLIT